jgi:hypothetical protein
MKGIVGLIMNTESLSDKELSERADSLTSLGPPARLIKLEHSVQFLNGVLSEASFLLPAYYSFFATSLDAKKASSIDGYPGAVLQCYMNKSALSYISLVARKLFDHSNDDSLNGAKFSKTSDCTLKKHAERWASFSGRPKQDAINALEILRTFFKICSQNPSDLLKEESRLCKKIGLVKQYANREAAHLTFQNYEVSWLDVLHITASMVLVAEIVRSFDRPEYKESYYHEINDAAFTAIKKLYPKTQEFKLFEGIEIAQLAKNCIDRGERYSMELLLEKIPETLSYYWGFPPSAQL